MGQKPIRVLMIEDDPDYVEIVRLCLAEPEAMGLAFELENAERLAEGLTKLTAGRFDAVLVDLGLPDARGLEAVQAVLHAAPESPVLVSTNYGDEATALEAMRLGAQDFMIKASSDSRVLKRSIRYAIERKAAIGQRDGIIRAAADGMVVVDAGGVVQFVNAAAERVLGAPASRLLGKPFPHPAKPGESVLLELAREGGAKAAVEMRVTEVQWDAGPASLASLRDVTELRRLEQLKSEIAERRRVDELKDQWIGTLSHELRTPLTIIKGAVVDLHEGQAEPLGPQQAMLVGLARRQAERVERMVVHLLDLTRLESGRAKVDRRSLDAAALVRRVAGDFERAAADRALRIEVDLDAAAPKVSADPDLFEQMVVNLLENAIRFARARIGVSVRGLPGSIEVRVSDDGIGIPPEKKELLFTRFNQLDRKHRSPDGYKGTGLGLAICKEIAGIHRGFIEVESEPGRGTTFVVRLPPDGSPTPPVLSAARGDSPGPGGAR